MEWNIRDDFSADRMNTGIFDKNGREIVVGDRVVTDHGYEGEICFGVYGSSHYGVYIRWKNTPGVIMSYLRTDILFWALRLTVVNEREDLVL